MPTPNDHLTPRDTPIKAGEKAPLFTLPDQDKKDVSLAALLGKGDVVLSFFPMAFTSVCGAEMGCFTKDLAKFQSKGATVLGVSCDSWPTLKAWAEKEGIKAVMLADMHRQVCRAYGIYFSPLNIAGRGTVVIDKHGVVKWVSARELGQAVKNEDVLAAIS